MGLPLPLKLPSQLPFLDLHRVNAPYEAAIRAGIGRVIDSGW